LGFLTARSAIQAAYINYDNANELLVYAHSAGGVKTALDQIEEISLRTTDGLAAEVAYDNETSYPYWWYLRNYNNARYYGENPSRSLREVPLILVGDANFGKIEPVVGNLYHRFDFIRLWWPNQDYYNLTWERIINALTNPAMRDAIFQIWLNRDYTRYGEVTEKDMSLPNWSPSARMRLYVRKDIVNQLWNYGAAPVAEEIEPDPFEGKHETLTADQIIGGSGVDAGQFQKPRDLAVASDGSIYVVDSENHRIQHLNPDGSVINVWGTFGDATTVAAEGGTFNQPWGIGLGPDGSVYIADTWNHRVQKFTPEGDFVTMWGYFGQGEGPLAFWGPRDVAVNADGEVFVTDTGNKRVVVFDENGSFITEFGSAGMGPGELDEPVGIAVDQNGFAFVADTWNQRIQVFTKDAAGNYSPLREWELWAWYGQSLDNKPYLNVDNRGSVFAIDPEGYRVLQYSDSGEPVRSWGDFGTGSASFGLPASVAVDLDGNVWVSDSGNSRLMHFIINDLVP
jgi:DNA-binding beta-propeller fold protein YncE